LVSALQVPRIAGVSHLAALPLSGRLAFPAALLVSTLLLTTAARLAAGLRGLLAG
jgi:hypothetical protein